MKAIFVLLSLTMGAAGFTQTLELMSAAIEVMNARTGAGIVTID